jgi:hypothetical protein
MTCPHCGADPSTGQKFCPKCSRLVDSPLLKIKQQIDAAREEIRRDLNAARTVRFSPPPPPPTHEQLPRPQYHVKVATPTPESPSPYKYAPHPSQTPGLTPPPSEVPRETILRSQNKRQRKKQRDEGITRAQHTDASHRFDPSATAQHAARDAAATNAAAAAGAVPERFKRPVSFSVLALLDVIGAIMLFYAALQLTLQYPEPRPPIIEFSRILGGATAFLFVITAFGMWNLHPYGRFFQRLLLLPAMIWVPIGTIYGIATWLYLGSKATRLYFSGRSPRSLNATELAAWRTSERVAPVFAFLLFAFGFVPGLAYATFVSGTLPLVFNEAARTFPEQFSQLTGTPALEGGAATTATETPAPSASSTDGAPEGDSANIAVVQIKQLQRAQAAYASLNEGYYDRLECVLTPAMCIRNGDERNKAVLLDQSFVPPQRHGYTFLLQMFGTPAARSDTASATSMRGYSYRALPSEESGDRTAYCGDETGLICAFDAKTTNDRGNGGRCPATCRPIE